MAEDKFVVDGFRFNSKEEADEARNEYDGVKYMRSRTNMKNPANVYSVYKSIVEKNLFKTPVGMKFLCELRDVLYASGQYNQDELDELVINVPKKEASYKSKEEKKKASRREVVRDMKKLGIESVYRNRFINSVIVNVILVIVIILIMVIAGNSENTNILNYKNRLDAEYNEKENSLAQWKSELEAMEESLKQRENELANEATD